MNDVNQTNVSRRRSEHHDQTAVDRLFGCICVRERTLPLVRRPGASACACMGAVVRSTLQCVSWQVLLGGDTDTDTAVQVHLE